MPWGALRTGLTLDLAGGHADTWSGRVAGPNPCPTRQPPRQRLYLWSFSLLGDRDRPWASSCPGPKCAKPTRCNCPVAPYTGSASCRFSSDPGCCAGGSQPS